jgi:hypothetical protein
VAGGGWGGGVLTSIARLARAPCPRPPPPPSISPFRPQLVGAELKNAGVNVFGNASKKDSLILTLPDIHQVGGLRVGVSGRIDAAPALRPPLCSHLTAPPRSTPQKVLGASTNASAVASMIGERVYVKWPYLQEAQVGGLWGEAFGRPGLPWSVPGAQGWSPWDQGCQAPAASSKPTHPTALTQTRQTPLLPSQILRVSDAGQELSAQGSRQMGKDEADGWSGLSARTRNLFLTKQGVETGPLPVLLHVKACTG